MNSPLSDYVPFADEEDEYVPGSPMLEHSAPIQSANIQNLFNVGLEMQNYPQQNSQPDQHEISIPESPPHSNNTMTQPETNNATSSCFFDGISDEVLSQMPLPIATCKNSEIKSTENKHNFNTNNETNQIFNPGNQFSDEAKALLGKRIPQNTKRAACTPLTRLISFLASRENVLSETELTLINDYRNTSDRRKELLSYADHHCKIILFPDGNNGCLPKSTNLSEEQEQHLNFYLIEFFSQLKKIDKNHDSTKFLDQDHEDEDLSPSTFQSYVLGIQRAFELYWGYKVQLVYGSVFGNKDTGLKTVLDNKCKNLQGKGKYPRGHNVLSEDDIVKIYKSEHLNVNHPLGLITRLIFDIAFVTTWRPGMISALQLDQVEYVLARGAPAYRITSRIASDKGSKTAQGGLRESNQKPIEVTIWKSKQLDGVVCVFDTIELYLNCTKKIHRDRKNLFLSVNYAFQKNKYDTYFKNCKLGAKTLPKYVKRVCELLNITGDGVRHSFTAHGIRATCITNLFEAGFERESIATKTGHRQPKSLKGYQSTRGALGFNMQVDMFGQSEKKSKLDCKRPIDCSGDVSKNLTEHSLPIVSSPKKAKIDVDINDGQVVGSSGVPGWFSNISNFSGQVIINNYMTTHKNNKEL